MGNIRFSYNIFTGLSYDGAAGKLLNLPLEEEEEEEEEEDEDTEDVTCFRNNNSHLFFKKNLIKFLFLYPLPVPLPPLVDLLPLVLSPIPAVAKGGAKAQLVVLGDIDGVFLGERNKTE